MIAVGVNADPAYALWLSLAGFMVGLVLGIIIGYCWWARERQD